MKQRKKKKVTMKDIAEKLSLSINAVSLAINDKSGVSDETRKIILKTAKEMGYFDNNISFVVKNHFKNICVLIEERNFLDNYFYTKVILGIEKEAKKNYFDNLVNFMNPDSFQIPPSIENGKVSGIIIVGNIRDEYLEKLLEYNIPTVLVDHASLTINSNAVLTQNMSGSYMMTQYLIKKGHTQIGFWGDIGYSLSIKERWLGFNVAMQNAGLEVDNDYCITGPVEQYVLQKNYNKVANIISKLDKLPTAWLCSNDNAAITLYNALNILDINVPDSISIVGFDDIDICDIVRPRLTTMHVDKELMGARAVRKLLRLIENPEDPCEHIRMPVKLIERESVKSIL